MSTNAKTAASQAGSLELAAALKESIKPILMQLYRKINIDQVRVESGLLEDLDIDKVVLGDVDIDKVILAGTSASLKGADAFLQGVNIILNLSFSLELDIDIDFFGFGFGDWSVNQNLGNLFFPMSLGDVRIQSLTNIDMNIPNLTADNLQANIAPVNGLDLNGAKIKKILANDTELPTGGFELNGLGIGGASINNLSIPGTSTQSVKIEEFEPNSSVIFPGAELSNLKIPSAQVDNISTDEFGFDTMAAPRSIKADFGIVEIKLFVTPFINMNVNSMILKDITLEATVNKLKVQDIKVPIKIRGINMKDLVLNTVKIGEISL